MATQNIGLTTPPFNSSNWNSPLNANFAILDAVAGNSLNISVSGTSYSLTPTDLQNRRITVNGSIGANKINIIFPDGIGGSWIVSNNTVASGGGIVLRTASYTAPAIPVPAGGSIFIYSDTRNIFLADTAAKAVADDLEKIAARVLALETELMALKASKT